MRASGAAQDEGPDGCVHASISAGKERLESNLYLKLQEESGFVKTVLASPEEDIWNDL